MARLPAYKTDRNPLVLKMPLTSGHKGVSGRSTRLREAAFELAFLFGLVGWAP